MRRRSQDGSQDWQRAIYRGRRLDLDFLCISLSFMSLEKYLNFMKPPFSSFVQVDQDALSAYPLVSWKDQNDIINTKDLCI